MKIIEIVQGIVNQNEINESVLSTGLSRILPRIGKAFEINFLKSLENIIGKEISKASSQEIKAAMRDAGMSTYKKQIAENIIQNDFKAIKGIVDKYDLTIPGQNLKARVEIAETLDIEPAFVGNILTSYKTKIGDKRIWWNPFNKTTNTSAGSTVATGAGEITRKFIRSEILRYIKTAPKLQNIKKDLINSWTDIIYANVKGKSDLQIKKEVHKLMIENSRAFGTNSGKQVASKWSKASNIISTTGKVTFGLGAVALAAIPVILFYLAYKFFNSPASEKLKTISNAFGFGGENNTIGVSGDDTSGQTSPQNSPKIEQLVNKYNGEITKDVHNNDIVRLPNYPGGGIILFLDDSEGGRVQSISNPKKVGYWKIKDLNENRLSLLKILNEQVSSEISVEEISKIAEEIYDQITGNFYNNDDQDIKHSYNEILKLKGKTYNGTDAVQYVNDYIIRRYKLSIEDLINQKLTKLSINGEKYKEEILKLLHTPSATTNTNTNDGIEIVWNDEETSQQPAQPAQQPAQPAQPAQQPAQQGRPPLQFHECQGTYVPGCINIDNISQVQRCLDLTSPKFPRGSGYFDYNLIDKLSVMGYKNGFTDADIPKICEMAAKKTKPFEAQENDTPGESTETPRQTYEKYYAKFDGKETDRVKLKINNLPDSDLKNLNKYFVTQGLYKIKNPKRRYGTKFVWGKKPS